MATGRMNWFRAIWCKIFLLQVLVRVYRVSQEIGERMWVVVKIMVPFWVPYYNTAPNIWGTQKGIILTTTHVSILGVQFGGL